MRTSVIAFLLLSAILTLATLLIPPFLRIALGSYDINSAGLRPYVRFWRSDQPTHADRTQLSLLLYFLLLVALSTLAFASCYNVLWQNSIQKPGLITACSVPAKRNVTKPFTFADQTPNCEVVAPITWSYFSAVTIATVGYGDISPRGRLSQTLTGLQILDGPFLITWVLALAANRSSRSTPQASEAMRSAAPVQAGPPPQDRPRL